MADNRSRLFYHMIPSPEDIMNGIDRDLTNEDERIFQSMIINRDPRAFDMAMKMFDIERVGLMNKDPQINQICLAIASITLITRFCVRGGMLEKEAYAISDKHLQRLYTRMDWDKLQQWYQEAVTEFIGHMPPLNISMELPSEFADKEYSKPVRLVMNYVLKHICQPLILKDICAELYFSPDYISSLFRKETGVTFSRYVRTCKIECAKEMLLYTQNSSSSIANALSFSSQSYFIKTFREETGLTPSQYVRQMQELL